MMEETNKMMKTEIERLKGTIEQKKTLTVKKSEYEKLSQQLDESMKKNNNLENSNSIAQIDIKNLKTKIEEIEKEHRE